MAGGSFGGGTGTVGDPYLVEDALDVNAMRTKLGGTYFKLTNNIDMSTDYPTSWVPLINSGSNPLNTFNSHIDGADYTISNLKNALVNVLYGVISNLKVTVSISVTTTVGAFCVEMFLSSTSSLFNCHASGTITSSGTGVGGLVGAIYRSESSISGVAFKACTSSVNVTGDYTYTGGAINDGVGGLLGATYNTSTYTGSLKFEDCKCTGTVTGKARVGGILGWSGFLRPSIVRCIATGNIAGISYAAGILGAMVSNGNYSVTISACEALMSTITRVSGADANFGRIVGVIAGTVTLSNNRALDTMAFIP